jgi:hypothetical protein
MTPPSSPRAGEAHTHKINAGCFPSCPAHYSRAGEAEGGVRRALERFLNMSYPNNGEGRTDRLVWMVPESAFGPLRAALASPEPDEEARP